MWRYCERAVISIVVGVNHPLGTIQLRVVEMLKDHRELIAFRLRNPSTICVFSSYYTGEENPRNHQTVCVCVFYPQAPRKKPRTIPPGSNACTPSVRGYSKECKKGISRPRSRRRNCFFPPLSVRVTPTASGAPDSLCIIVVCQPGHFWP